MQFPKKPALLEGGLGRRAAQGPVQNQGLGFPHGPHRDLDRVLAQPLERPHPFVPVDHHKSVPLDRHHHDGDLLTVLRQGRYEPAFTLRTAYSQSLVAQIQLVKLDLHGPSVPPARWACTGWSVTPCPQKRPLSLTIRKGYTMRPARDRPPFLSYLVQCLGAHLLANARVPGGGRRVTAQAPCPHFPGLLASIQ